MKKQFEERERKAKIIVDIYDDGRKYTQTDIAKILKIPVDVVSRVTQLYNYEHTKKKTRDNITKKQKINMIIDYLQLDFLDKYNF